MAELVVPTPRKATTPTTRRVMTSWEDVRHEVIRVSTMANRELALLTHNLNPSLYNQLDFVEQIKRLVLSKRGSRIRILTTDPTLAIKETHLLIELARQLSSFIQLRTVAAQFRDREDAFLIADRQAIVYRPHAGRAEGIADVQAAEIALRYLTDFNEIWEHSTPEPEFRRLYL